MISDGVAYTVTKILEQNVLLRDRHAARTSAVLPRGRPARPTIMQTPGSAATLPNLQATVWVGYPQGEIPMQNVHGIAVAGGSFPAEIWRRFMEQATRYSPAQDFPLPRTYPTWTSWQRGNYDIVYQVDEHIHLHHHDDDTGDDPCGDDGRTDAADDHARADDDAERDHPCSADDDGGDAAADNDRPAADHDRAASDDDRVTTTQPAQ